MRKKSNILLMFLLCLFMISSISGYNRAEAKSKNGISSVRFIDNDVVRVKFSKARKLSKKNIKIFSKEKKKDKYGKSRDIQKIEKVNGRVYDVILKKYNAGGMYVSVLSYGDFVRIKIGNDSVEAICYDENKPQTIYFTGVTNKHKNMMVDFEGYVKGNCKYSISKLPKGIKAKKYSKCVLLSGKPKTVLNGKKVTITATDSYGRKVTNEVLFYIGSPKRVVTYAYNAEDKTVLSGDKQKEKIFIESVGGSGKYKYKKTNKVSGVKCSGDGVFDYFKVSDGISTGKHTIKYSVTDSKGHKASASIKFNVQKAVKLTVSLKTADNKNIANQEMEFSEHDFNNKYLIYSYNVEKNKNNYTAYVAPDMLYKVVTGMSAEYQYCRTAKKDKKFNIKTPMYKISLKSSDNSSLDEIQWDIDGGNIKRGKAGPGSVLYLEKGTYEVFGERAYNVYNASFKVDKSKSVTVDAYALSDSGDLTENKKRYVKVSSDGNVYTFTPSKTGLYTFWVEDLGEDNEFDVSMYKEASMNESDSILKAWIYRGGTYTVELEAGHKYYLSVKTSNDYNNGMAALVGFDNVTEIKAEEKVSVTVESDKTKYFVFRPDVTSYYTINIYGADKDVNPVWMNFMQRGGDILAQNSYGDGGSYKTKRKLEAGNTYYLKLFTESNMNIKIQIHRNGSK